MLLLQGQAQDPVTTRASGAWGCCLPASPHYCALCGHFLLLRVNQDTFLPCQLPPGDICQMVSMSLSLSFSMYYMVIIKLRGFKQGHLPMGPTHLTKRYKRQPFALHTAEITSLPSYFLESPSADTILTCSCLANPPCREQIPS